VSTYDVIVVGAGTSGAALAGMLAERGLRVLCVEKRRLTDAGARWINGVPRASFAEAGIPLPSTDESDGKPAVFHLVAGGGRVLVPTHDVIEVDMRKLVARLQSRALAAGAELRDEISVAGRDGDRLMTSAGPLRARYIVDASGMTGARLLDQPRVHRDDVCAAAQEVREVLDRDAALEYFGKHDVREGEVLGFVGVAGGYSVLNVRLHHGGATVGILTGSIPSLGFPSGKAILDDFVARHAWVGPRVFGGAGPIPLRRAHDRLANEQVALLGDAGCQVFPAHGSGIGAGLVAARLLADTLARGGSLRDYEVAWQRKHGGVFAFFDVFRRWNQTVSEATIGRAMHGGLIDAETLRAGIDQALPRPSLRTVATKARGLLAQPVLAKVVAQSVAVRALYARYPRRHDRVAAWARQVDRVLGTVTAR
jgi:flavin-dependent dehydrogenase